MRDTDAKFNSWWVAEISFRAGNPPHRCIANKSGDSHWEIHGNYEGVEDVYLPRLRERGGEFVLIEEIVKMRQGQGYGPTKIILGEGGRARAIG